MTIVVCDLCGRKLYTNQNTRVFKVKECKSLWDESHWETIDVHDECIKMLLGAVKEGKE